MPANEESSRYEILLTDEATYAFADVYRERVRARIEQLVGFLAEHPLYGEEYDPYYPAARPPVPCRVFFCGRYGIYYHVDESQHMVVVLTIEDTRMSPMGRFS